MQDFPFHRDDLHISNYYLLMNVESCMYHSHTYQFNGTYHRMNHNITIIILKGEPRHVLQLTIKNCGFMVTILI